jgi:hypothetical protein
LILAYGFHPDFSISHSFFCGQHHLLILFGLALGSEQLARLSFFDRLCAGTIVDCKLWELSQMASACRCVVRLGCRGILCFRLATFSPPRLSPCLGGAGLAMYSWKPLAHNSWFHSRG